MKKVIYGTENYCIDIIVKKMLEEFNCLCLSECGKTEESEASSFLTMTSFFDQRDKKVIVFPEDLKSLKKVLSWDNENIIIIFYGEIRDVEEVELVCYNKLTLGQIKKFVKERLPQLSDNLLDYFVKKTSYLTDGEVTLYNVVSEIDKLKCLDVITEKILDLSVGEPFVDGNAFLEAEYVVTGNVSGAIKNAFACPEGQELAFIGAMQRFFRVGWKKNFFNESEVGRGKIVKKDFAVDAIVLLNEASNSIITGKLPAKIALRKSILKLIEKWRECYV